MKNEELCKYIYHYATEDKTQSAIMLSGEWGTGKSYFIKNELTAYLQSKDVRIVVISLYGLKTIDDISRSIYWNIRASKIKLDDEKKTTGVAIAKTVAKGVAGFFRLDMSVSDEDLKKIYESIDLTDKLIVIEDVERTEIDLFSLLGYVNNLTENDGAKVLLVANEVEIIKKEIVYDNKTSEIRRKTGEKANKDEEPVFHYEYTSETKRYLSVKEKTISDTIMFEGEIDKAVTGIIRKFGDGALDPFCQLVDDIEDIMNMCRCHNLRAFIFACQKANDIFKCFSEDYNEDYRKCIFYSIIAFSLRTKKGKEIKWENADRYSFELGISKYPLFRFCFDYLTNHIIYTDEIGIAYEELCKLRLYDQGKTRNDKDISIISNYYCEYEKDVIAAVESITNRLDDINDISFYDYGRIAEYLVIIKHYYGVDISKAKMLLVDNLRGRGDEIDVDALFHNSLHNEREEIQNEYREITTAIYEVLRNNAIIPGFEYKHNQSGLFYDYVCKNEVVFHGKEKFAAVLDIERIVEMFSKSSPEEMHDIRGAFLAMYRPDNIRGILSQDKPHLINLKKGIEEYYEHGDGDQVQKLQAKWFIQNLDEFINKL